MIKNFILFSLPKHLIYLIPVFLVTGPFLSDLAVTLISIIFIVILFKEKNFSIFNNKFYLIFFIFYFYLIINSLSQNQNYDSLRISFTYVRFGLFSLALMYFLSNDAKLIKKIFYSLIVTFVILIFDGCLQYFLGKNILGWNLKYPGPRVSSLFGDELILGSYIARMFPIFIGLMFFFNFSKDKKFLFYILILGSLFLILISGERTAFFLTLLSFVLMFFLIFENKKIIRNVILVAFTCCIVIIAFSDSIKARIVDVTLEKMLASKNQQNKSYIISKQHHEHYVSGMRMFLNNPLSGVGVKNFRVFCSEKEYYISDYTCSPHPHNTYIQLLSETGIVGFLIVLLCFIYLNMRLIFHYKESLNSKPVYKDYQICFLISFYLTLWPLVPSGNFFNNWLSIIYFYPLGIFLWSVNKQDKNINKSNKS